MEAEDVEAEDVEAQDVVEAVEAVEAKEVEDKEDEGEAAEGEKDAAEALRVDAPRAGPPPPPPAPVNRLSFPDAAPVTRRADPPVSARPDSSPRAIPGAPTRPDPAVLAALEDLRSAITGLASGPDPAVAAGLESLRSATTALSTRVDALADANSSFRSVLNERLDEYAETVLRVLKGVSTDVEEYRRMHATSITELRRTGAETADSLARLAGQMEELVTIQADDERWVEVMRQLCDEVTAERQQGERREQARAAEASSATERLAAVEETLDLLARHVAELSAGAQAAQEQSAPPLLLDDRGLRSLASAVAEALAEQLPPTASVPPAPAKRAPAKRVAGAPVSAATSNPAPRRPRRTTPIQVRGPSGRRD